MFCTAAEVRRRLDLVGHPGSNVLSVSEFVVFLVRCKTVEPSNNDVEAKNETPEAQSPRDRNVCLDNARRVAFNASHAETCPQECRKFGRGEVPSHRGSTVSPTRTAEQIQKTGFMEADIQVREQRIEPSCKRTDHDHGPSVPGNEGCVLGGLRVGWALLVHCVDSARELLWWNCHGSKAFLSPWTGCERNEGRRNVIGEMYTRRRS